MEFANSVAPTFADGQRPRSRKSRRGPYAQGHEPLNPGGGRFSSPADLAPRQPSADPSNFPEIGTPKPSPDAKGLKRVDHGSETNQQMSHRSRWLDAVSGTCM